MTPSKGSTYLDLADKVLIDIREQRPREGGRRGLTEQCPKLAGDHDEVAGDGPAVWRPAARIACRFTN
jgi:hypothetical protein